ncbi:MAG: DUF433 domain-containing protein [Candidatus Zixiibacteriota bacterium]
MRWKDRILVDPQILVGKPVIKGTRIAVAFIMQLLAEGWTYEQILENYPDLVEEDIRAAIAYANEVVQMEKVYPVAD